MRVILDARCTSCNQIDEVFGHREDAFRCTYCGGVAKAIISPVRCKLEGASGDFPGAAMKWAREHIKHGNKP